MGIILGITIIGFLYFMVRMVHYKKLYDKALVDNGRLHNKIVSKRRDYKKYSTILIESTSEKFNELNAEYEKLFHKYNKLKTLNYSDIDNKDLRNFIMMIDKSFDKNDSIGLLLETVDKVLGDMDLDKALNQIEKENG